MANEVMLKLPRGNRGAIVIERVTEMGQDKVRLYELFPDPVTGEQKSTRGFHFKLEELTATGALFTAVARNIEAIKEKARAASPTPSAAPSPAPAPAPVPPPVAAPVEVLPKAATAFVGTREVAKRGGTCVVCGDPVVAMETYLWSDQRRAGAHVRCGREQQPAAPKRTVTTSASAPKQRELPGTRRQPQDSNVGAVSEEERRLAEEVF
jgi:hypothetical protein